MKIAFCFLTCKNLNNPVLWKHFFTNNEKFNIYIHNKEEINDEYGIYSIPNKIDTKWGDISLVKATMILFEEAFKNKENEYFLLLSESCIPLHNFNFIYDKIINKNGSIINIFESKDKNHQWILLKRDLLEWFINNKCFDDYKDFKTPDEFYFIDLINKNNLRNKFKIYDIPLTFVNWKDLSSNPKYRISPKTYDNLNNKEYNNIVANKYLFARKFSDICNFNYQIFKNININISSIIKNWGGSNIYWLQLEDRKNQILSLYGSYDYLLDNNINPKIINYNDIESIPNNSNLMISGNYNNLQFNQKILKLQEKHKILLLPHSNLNKFLIRKFDKNIIAFSKDLKTYNYYKENNIKAYLSIDMSFYVNTSKFNLYNKELNNHTEILYNDEIIRSHKYDDLKLEVESLLNLLIKYKYIKTNQIDMIIGCILLNKFCEINDSKNSLNKFYFDYFLNKIDKIKFITI